MTLELLKTRRKKLGEALNNGDIAIVFAAEMPAGISKFQQNNNFLYLTGLYETAEAVFVLQKQADKITETLFIERNIPEKIVWDGAKLYPEEAQEISGIQTIKFLDEFDNAILPLLAVSKVVYINSGFANLNKPLNNALYWVSKVRERIIHLSFSNLNNILMPLRQIKDTTEIQYLTKAIEITGIGLNSIFKNAREGMYEYELEAMLLYEMKKRGLNNFGFAPIIATGINAATLHYKRNECIINKGDLVLCDVGALYNNYSADITRTFPINKTFSPRQKEVYIEVLNVQKEIISMIKPGILIKDLQEHTTKLIGEACIKLGLITDPKDFNKYYMHGIGHFLGMDTHDVGNKEIPLSEGMVITVEPGIYIPEENIGVRIEDDILVTSTGYKNLSVMIPKEIEELENLR